MFDIAMAGGVDLLVGIPSFPLSHLVCQLLDRQWVGGRVQLSLETVELVDDLVDRPFTAGKRHLPTIAAWQIAAMPLGTNVVQLSEQAETQQVHCVVIQHAVVALVSGGQMQAGLFGDAGHGFALGHVVRHQFFGQHMLAAHHGLDGDGSVQEERQCDNDRFNARDRRAVLACLHFRVCRPSHASWPRPRNYSRTA